MGFEPVLSLSLDCESGILPLSYRAPKFDARLNRQELTVVQRQLIRFDKISTDVSPTEYDYIVFYSEGYTQVLRMQNQYKFGVSDSFF